MRNAQDALRSIHGQMIGDAIGLPFEGLFPKHIPSSLPYGLCGQRIMVSDDSEHALLTLAAVVRSSGEPAIFERLLQSYLRRWLAGFPPSLGRATFFSCTLLCLGRKRGIRSQGNGALMRVPAIAVGAPPDKINAFVEISTRMTHDDQRSITAAKALAACFTQTSPRSAISRAIQESRDDDLIVFTLKDVLESYNRDESLKDWAHRNLAHANRGVSGWIVETLAAVLRIWLAHPDDYRRAVEAAIRLGGDTDTTSGLVGSLVAYHSPNSELPIEWTSHLWDIYNVSLLQRVLNWADPLPALPIRISRNLTQTAIMLFRLSFTRPILFLRTFFPAKKSRFQGYTK